jgi:mRNA interferase YafQ
MREIEWSIAFKKDIRRESKGPHLAALNTVLPVILDALSNDVQMPPNYNDHKLTGEWEGCRECHVRPNLLLIYDKQDEEILRLSRLGSHSELFGA